MLRDLLVKNLDVIYFFYGLAFVTLGLMIFIQLRAAEKSRFQLLNILGLLGWFGLLHGASEFTDMWLIIKGESFFLGLFDSSFLFVSYLMIFLFGYRLMGLTGATRLSPWLPFAVSAAFLALPLLVGADSFQSWNISIRYFFGFTGALLSAVGLPLYYRLELKSWLGETKIKRYFISGAVFFAIYGVAAGFFVPAADFFPANLVNNDSFVAWFGFPPQLVRAASAIGLAWSFWNIVDIFNIEKADERRLTNEALKREKEKAEQYFQIAGAVLVVIDADENVRLINKRGLELLGCSEEQVVGRNWFDNFLPPEIRAEARSVFSQVASGEADLPGYHESPIIDRQGERRLIAWHNTVLRDEAGNVTGGLSAGEDITERKQAEEELRRARDELEERVGERTDELARSNDLLREEAAERRRNEQLSAALNDINRAINSTLVFDEIMQLVVVEAARALDSETAAIEVRRGENWPVKYIYRLPQNTVGRPLTGKEAMISKLAAQTGKPVAVEDAYNDPRLDWETMKRLELRAFLAAPVISRNEPLGTIIFNYHSVPVSFSRAEIDFAAKLASSVSLALENARLYETERNIADTLQEALLTVPDKVPGITFGHFYHAGVEPARVGGDFYDVFEIEHDRIGLVIGDVSGKGLEAATLTALIRNTIKAYSYEKSSPAAVMAGTNEVLVKSSTASMFATVFFGRLDVKSGVLTYCNAGHPPPVLKRSTGGGAVLLTPSPAIGVLSGFDYEDAKETMNIGDTLVLYTDGLIEARCDDELFGEDRLARMIEGLPPADARALPQLIFESLMGADCRLTDDLALMTLARTDENR